MKKLVVSEDTCISCGACIQIDEEHFDFSSKGLSTVKTQENLDSEALHQAIDACPVAAIRLEEIEENVTTQEKNAINNIEDVSIQEETDNDNNEGCNCAHSNKCENCTCHNEEI